MTTIDQTTTTDSATEPAPIDMDALMAFVGQVVGDLGATVAAGSVLLGERLGLYRAVAQGASDAAGLAAATGTDPRYCEEWLRGQAASGYVEYDAEHGTFSMTPEKAFALTDPAGPVFLPGAFELALGALKAQEDIEDAFRTGDGFGWHEHDTDVFTGCERFFRPGYLMHLLTEWIPSLEGVQAKLEQRRPRGRPRLRARGLDPADGRGVPEQHVRRVGLPRGLDRGSARAGRGSRRGRPGRLRGLRCADDRRA